MGVYQFPLLGGAIEDFEAFVLVLQEEGDGVKVSMGRGAESDVLIVSFVVVASTIFGCRYVFWDEVQSGRVVQETHRAYNVFAELI